MIVESLLATNPAPRRVIGREATVMAAMVRVLPFRLMYRMVQGRR